MNDSEGGHDHPPCWALAAVPAALLAAPAAAAPSDIGAAGGNGFAAGQVVVRYEPGTSRGERAAVRNELDAELERRLLVPRHRAAGPGAGRLVKGAVAALERQPDVAFAEPDFVYRLATLPDDDQFPISMAARQPRAPSGSRTPTSTRPRPGARRPVTPRSSSRSSTAASPWSTTTWTTTSGPIPASPVAASRPTASDDDGNTQDRRPPRLGLRRRRQRPHRRRGPRHPRRGHDRGRGQQQLGIAGVVWDVSLMPLRACNMVGLCLSSRRRRRLRLRGRDGAPTSSTRASRARASRSRSRPRSRCHPGHAVRGRRGQRRDRQRRRRRATRATTRGRT